MRKVNLLLAVGLLCFGAFVSTQTAMAYGELGVESGQCENAEYLSQENYVSTQHCLDFENAIGPFEGCEARAEQVRNTYNTYVEAENGWCVQNYAETERSGEYCHYLRVTFGDRVEFSSEDDCYKLAGLEVNRYWMSRLFGFGVPVVLIPLILIAYSRRKRKSIAGLLLLTMSLVVLGILWLGWMTNGHTLGYELQRLSERDGFRWDLLWVAGHLLPLLSAVSVPTLEREKRLRIAVYILLLLNALFAFFALSFVTASFLT